VKKRWPNTRQLLIIHSFECLKFRACGGLFYPLNYSIMKPNLIRYMPTDQVRICNGKNLCIEARGENARALVASLIFLLMCVGIYYLSKAE
jgi:hypothetical protein